MQPQQRMIELFGEDHIESDEEEMQQQREIQHRLYEAVGTESEPEETPSETRWEDTDISDIEAVMEKNDQLIEDMEELTDAVDLHYSDLSDNEETVTIPIGRMQVTNFEVDTRQQAKALAQLKRQKEANVTKYNLRTVREIPIVALDAEGKEVCQDELMKNEAEIIRRAEHAIRGRNVLDATLELIQIQGDQKLMPGEQQGHGLTPVDIKIRTSSATVLSKSIPRSEVVTTVPELTKAEKRVASKKAWYQRKKDLKRRKYQS